MMEVRCDECGQLVTGYHREVGVPQLKPGEVPEPIVRRVPLGPFTLEPCGHQSTATGEEQAP